MSLTCSVNVIVSVMVYDVWRVKSDFIFNFTHLPVGRFAIELGGFISMPQCNLGVGQSLKAFAASLVSNSMLA
jgi:hypothetical protein